MGPITRTVAAQSLYSLRVARPRDDAPADDDRDLEGHGELADGPTGTDADRDADYATWSESLRDSDFDETDHFIEDRPMYDDHNEDERETMAMSSPKPATIRIEFSRTYSLGDFQPLRLGASLERELSAGETIETAVAATFSTLRELVSAEHIRALAAETAAAHTPPPKQPPTSTSRDDRDDRRSRDRDDRDAKPGAYGKPKTGPALFAHLKSLEESGTRGVLRAVDAEARKRGWPKMFRDYSDADVADALAFATDWVDDAEQNQDRRR